MKIVRSWDLLAADLPRLESPFFAASKARSLILDNSHNANKVDLERLLGRSVALQGGGRASRYNQAALIDEVVRRIDDRALWLVFEACDGEPSDPVVCWQESGEGAGRWVAGQSGASSELRRSVDELNRHGITPQQLTAQRIGGVGHLGATRFDVEYRLRQREEDPQQHGQAARSKSMSHQNLMPLTLSVVEPRTSDSLPEIHLEIGLFTDGTLNNADNSRELEERAADQCVESYRQGTISKEECSYQLGLMMGGSYGNAPSNVAKLADMYVESSEVIGSKIIHRLWVYTAGVGTKTGEGDSLIGAATGMGETGIISQVEKTFSRVAVRIDELELAGSIKTLTFDLFGFSRGAAAARHAAHEILLGDGGALGGALASQRIDWPGQVLIRFVGLFDTVAAVINPMALDLRPGNGRNEPVRVYLDPSKVKYAAQIMAADEHRENFALSSLRNADGSIPENFREIALPGVHSDIGGGYPATQLEEVLVSPFHLVPANRIRWPEQTIQWDNLNALKRHKVADGWIGSFSLPVGSMDEYDPTHHDLGVGGGASLSIVKNISAHPAPDGRVELVLKMVRQVRGEYSRVGLRVMHELATKVGVPFTEVDSAGDAARVPDDLGPVTSQILEQIAAGADSPSLTQNQQNLIRQRYTHYSANYNPFKFMLGDALTAFRFGRNFSPNAPTASGERVIHPNA
ncbi:T6SS phospholipase effector Tle1-like catalytic domain-containing protein [Marinobacter halophilus]|uniref:DUF2235 domain-containing protein n=1 Tax=Marinobacter halophilus TaxID=1323740 RepID=A0A2T1KG73_9GAMM|nr:DUF2235 domain-containing protein [Marinobacter halophilus]PSF09119.1 DUF2235 domain-containing protein [Marinobacter halophilus]GGC83212.1 hypothetical protein GCM10011362_34550 [Marinobacter halophilus]